MEYAWHPEPYLSESYPIWNPSLDDRGRKAQQAAALVDEKRWDEAEATLRQLLRDKDNDGPIWYQLGMVLHVAGRLDAAILAHKRAAEFAEVKALALYNLGCAYALKKRPAEAMTALEGSIAAGFDRIGAFAGDSDLASLRGTPRFEKLLASLKRR